METEKIDLLKTKDGQIELARNYVALLEADDTEPVPERNSWIGEKNLRDFESLALPRKLYNEFAAFCQTGSEFAEVPTVQALLKINQINGLRRLPEGERPDELILKIFEETKKYLAELEESPRKERLMSLWAYHAGIFSRVIGDYELAAESQDRSAEISEKTGDFNSAAISRFCAAFERVNEALVKNPGGVKAELAKKREAGQVLYKNLDEADDPTSIRWKLLSGPHHLLLTHFWANEQYNGAEAYNRLIKLKTVDPELAANLNSSISVALAVQAWNENNLAKAEELASGVIAGTLGATPSPEYVATAHLLLGRIAAVAGKKAEAELRLKEAIAVQGSAHQVRAVAKRELAALNG